ncbi:sulfatase-like hydrolase/transferase [Flammeovirga sp. OC4]|uniref:sulfatase-like hydrolase/transferase n=1 Tax=Flammeovirga sp. OC4 TaxID=1382345 RepID=UPI0005C49737|nr:sulfatase-like hydrolase/transferase [Flammeovirga sp. OC4]
MRKTTFYSCLIFLMCLNNYLMAQSKPNVLWLLTDDQRHDSIRAFNKMLTGKKNSKLGYVESPNVDRLASMGTTFINTYCQAAGCAPSRTSMHLGRYPFRSGVYEFEYYNNSLPHFKPTLPEQMQALGYQTLHIGKLGVRIKELQKNGKTKGHKIYETDIDFKSLHKDRLTDWGKDWASQVEGEKLEKPIKNLEYVVQENGEVIYISKDLEQMKPKYKGSAQKAYDKYDLLRHYNDKKGPQTPYSGGILSGVSSQPAGKTRDGVYAQALVDYLENDASTFKIGSKTYKGIDDSKPLFCHVGFDFPHTPVLPPADYRKRFQKYTYNVPELDANEMNKMPKQLKNQVKRGYSDHFTDEEKQKMVQDYYAFCAYGDRLIGETVDAFIKYSESKNQEWLIVYVCGDHGWKLNEHGSVSKFSPWDVDVHNPIIVVSSDKKKFPKGKVVRDFTEFVDIAPTILAAGGADIQSDDFAYLDGLDMAKVVAEEAPKRDYIIGESHAVTGPRAFIRTERFMFSIQSRPNKVRGKDMEWATTASYKDLDPCLYDLQKDPNELNNLAFSKKYQKIAQQMKEKLVNVVIGDNRVEVNWKKWGTGTDVYKSNFAEGAHDYKLKLDESL